MPLCPNFDFASAVLPRNLRVLCGAAASAIRPETLFYHFMPLSRLLSVALLSIAISHPAVSQVNQPKASYFEAGQLKSFYTTYVYTAYTVHDIHPFLADELAGRGAVRHGLTWQFCRPPVRDLEYEMDCRGVAVERVLPASR